MKITDPTFNPSGDDRITAVKEAYANLSECIEYNVPDCRRRSIALTNLETSAMYAVKAIAVGDE